MKGKEEEQRDEVDEFTGTAVRLMRLTRENKIEWRRKDHAFAFVAEFGGFRFRLEEVEQRVDPTNPLSPALHAIGSSLARAGMPPPKDYRLVVFDEEAEEELASPPMQAARDLASIVEKRLAAEARKVKEMKFSDVNRRLDEALES